MLSVVRGRARLAIVLAAAALAAFAGDGPSRSFEPQSPSNPQKPTQPSPLPPPGRQLKTVVLDPAHGGTDAGAHGAGGIVEKDICLALAQAVRARLAQDGLSVVMTRQEDETVTLDERAAIANAQANAIFVSVHVGSTGTVGTAQAYFYDFGQLAPLPAAATAAAAGLVPWDLAQLGSADLSRSLAQLVQAQLSERLAGSAQLPAGAAVYELRAIAEPAIAVELASVDAGSQSALEALAGPLGAAISKGIATFRAVYQAERR
ncbi:MAG TPA: N-acetylmuramoyl-L-alanine amidase [Candidatus Acidoferrales bacterium]|nr:N-acetylmuramoyl-L-alanine amidase [Candidatus Acidoferrales bacterium]